MSKLLRWLSHCSSLTAALLILVLTTLQGCDSNKVKPTFVDDALKQAQSDMAKPPTEVPDFVTSALISGGGELGAGAAMRFDIAANKLPAKTFFLSLVADSGENVVTHPDLTGKISLELNDVTLQETLEVVRDIYGYEYKYKNGIYTIYPSALRSEIFPINYIDVQRVGVTDTNVSIGQIRSSSGGRGGGGGSSQNTQASESANLLGMADSAKESGGSSFSPGSRVQTLNETDFWYAIENAVGSIIGRQAEGRSVMVNPQAGLVLVTAMPGELNAVREFLEKSEMSVKRQVVLETKILEVELREGFEAGIDWKSLRGQLQYTNNVTTFESPASILTSEENGPEVFSTILKVVDIGDLLSLLESQGSVQVLSSPRISTVNNQKAVIRVGKDEFFVTGLSNSTTSSAATTTTSPEVEFASFFSGISLDVTPQISDKNEVILHIHPIVSDVKDQIKEVEVGDSKLTLPLALREIRESDSIVRAKSGQVIVLGGLMQEISRDSDAQTPLLGRVPGLNAFFKRKSKQSVKTELVILLKPIVVEDESWQERLDDYGAFSQTMKDQLLAR